MNLRLKNRQAVRGELSQFVDDIIVPESMILNILETSVTEKEFLEQLYVLDHKISFVKEQSFKDSRSCQDAIGKIREYLLQKVYLFRKPMTNYQVPQNAMLKHKFFYQFLMTHEREVAREIRDEYVDTMGKILFSYFKAYTNRLMKLQYPFESLFRSQQYALLDNACREYLFVTEFFMVSGAAAQDLFNSIMNRTLTMFVVRPSVTFHFDLCASNPLMWLASA
ncbi:hypothetical protein V5799_000507 [Amblyomma americanum]|uniref:Vacuolar protein sorting-associated protein 52 homolog n=1 Tax=Amblyomma americanum TaxID=6943 RepID=A0AAQ4D2V2_AMBAM